MTSDVTSLDCRHIYTGSISYDTHQILQVVNEAQTVKNSLIAILYNVSITINGWNEVNFEALLGAHVSTN